jgi:hypothetical protein
MFALIKQTSGVKLVNLNGSPEVAVAITVPVPPVTTTGAVPKEMVCLE